MSAIAAGLRLRYRLYVENTKAVSRLNFFWGAKHLKGWQAGLPWLDFATRKDGLAHLYHCAAAVSRPLSSVPAAFVLPHQAELWRAAAEAAGDVLWVRKPPNDSCGDGIWVGHMAELDKDFSSDGSEDRMRQNLREGRSTATVGVTQRFVEMPQLIGDLKFDLRVYAAILQHVPGNESHGAPCVFVFQDGLARFATKPYDEAAKLQAASSGFAGQQLSDPRSVLTNYSLNSAMDLGGSSDSGRGTLGRAAHALLNAGINALGGRRANTAYIASQNAGGDGGLDASGKVLAHKWSAASAIDFIAAGAPPTPEHIASGRAGGGASGGQRQRRAQQLWEAIGAAIGETVSAAAALHTTSSRSRSHGHTGLGWDGDVCTTAISSAREGQTESSMGGTGDDLQQKQHMQHMQQQQEGEQTVAARFELIGVDIMFDTKGTAWLIELQRRPSLEASSALDLRVKSTLVRGLEQLLENANAAAAASTAAAEGKGMAGSEILCPVGWCVAPTTKFPSVSAAAAAAAVPAGVLPPSFDGSGDAAELEAIVHAVQHGIDEVSRTRTHH